MSYLTLETAETITLSGDGRTERTARLLVTGQYPKKNLTVTRGDLDALVANFSEPVPVKVEHIDSPLDPLGQVETVWREGDALYGRISFPAGIAAHLSDRGARGLSVGMLKGPHWRLQEASLTRSPHVPGATLLSNSATADAELVQLREVVKSERVERLIGDLKRSGRLVPAGEPFARILLSQEDTLVTLSDGAEPETAAAIFLKFVQAQPPAVRLSEIAPGPSGADQADEIEFDADAQEILKTLGVDQAAVAKTMKADMKKGKR